MAPQVFSLGDAHLCGSYAVLILLGNSSITWVSVDGSGGAIGAVGYARSILV
jgi:hypothetical protein